MNEHSREYHGVCHNPCSLRFKSSPKTKFENFLFMNDVKTEIHKRGGTSMFWISCFDWKFSLDMRTLSHMLTSPTINTTFRNFYRQKKQFTDYWHNYRLLDVWLNKTENKLFFTHATDNESAHCTKKNQLVSSLCFESSLINIKNLFIDGCEGESANYFKPLNIF